MRTFENLDALTAAAGEELGTSGWMTITQERINTFAEATDDHQWIHVDPDRAAAGPFGTTIAHGYLTLSLLPALMSSAFEVKGRSMGINYGLNRVRFPAPVPVDSRIRASVTLADVTSIEGGVQVVVQVTVECEGSAKPVCIAEWVGRYLA